MRRDTYFAPVEKTDSKQLDDEIKTVSNSSLLTALLKAVEGLLVIVDERRQIVAVNDAMCKALGITQATSVLGLRPGEILGCIHADKVPNGCGTTEACRSCGAVIAIVASLKSNEPQEQICALTVDRDGHENDLVFKVKSQPIDVEGQRFLMLFLQDITRQQHLAALERTFFHDINNMLSKLLMSSEALYDKEPSRLTQIIHHESIRLSKEIAIQQVLAQQEYDSYAVVSQRIHIDSILSDVESFFSNHPTAINRSIDFSGSRRDIWLESDFSLLFRVICNMVTNALEATAEDGTVRVSATAKDDSISISVWNNEMIAAEMIPRIFERNYSTKGESGRGTGTFSMKLLGEKLLGGKVSFTTDATNGTLFTFDLPFA